jgi:hypothetical protein
MYATYQREYENFTHLLCESIDALFQRFTVVVNNMRAVKLLHSLDRTVWGGKFEAIVESEKYDTLTVNELFSKLKSTEVDRGMTAKIEGPTDIHSISLSGDLKGKSNTNPSTRMFSLSSLMSLPDEEFDMLGGEELVLLTWQFERMHENRVNTRRNTRTCFQCSKPGHFVADCPEKVKNKDNYKHRARDESRFVAGGHGFGGLSGEFAGGQFARRSPPRAQYGDGRSHSFEMERRNGPQSSFRALVLLQVERVVSLIVVTMVVFVEVDLIGEMLWSVLTPLWSKWLNTGFTLFVLTQC